MRPELIRRATLMPLRRNTGRPQFGLRESVDWKMLNDRDINIPCYATNAFIEGLAKARGFAVAPGLSVADGDRLYVAMENEIHQLASAKYDRDGASGPWVELICDDIPKIKTFATAG